MLAARTEPKAEYNIDGKLCRYFVVGPHLVQIAVPAKHRGRGRPVADVIDPPADGIQPADHVHPFDYYFVGIGVNAVLKILSGLSGSLSPRN